MVSANWLVDVWHCCVKLFLNPLGVGCCMKIEDVAMYIFLYFGRVCTVGLSRFVVRNRIHVVPHVLCTFEFKDLSYLSI